MERADYINDTLVLQQGLFDAGIPLYYLTDNLREVVDFYKTKPFMQRFKGGLSSHEIGKLKPEKDIYLSLLHRYALSPSSCIFFDDVLANVEGARSVGITAHVFTTANACEKDLAAVGLYPRKATAQQPTL